MRKNMLTVGLVLGLATMMASLVGCNRDQPKKSYKGPFEGTALQINTESGEVAMKLIHPKYNQPITAKGYINEKTQVEVNGVTARAEDIHQGDPVKVTGYYENPGADNERFVVTTISVRRPDGAWMTVGQDDTAGSQPATRQAD